MAGNNKGALALKAAITEYEKYIGERVGWLERLGDALSGLDERLDYTNILLIRLLLLWGMPAAVIPEAPPAVTPIGITIPTYPTLAPPPTVYPVRPVIPTMTPLGTPISKLDRVSITSATGYQTVVEWTIPDRYFGELFQISLMASDYTHALFRLVLFDKEQWIDKYLMSALTQEFRGNELTERMKCLIQAKTDNVVNPFTAWGEIAGKEYQK